MMYQVPGPSLLIRQFEGHEAHDGPQDHGHVHDEVVEEAANAYSKSKFDAGSVKRDCRQGPLARMYGHARPYTSVP